MAKRMAKNKATEPLPHMDSEELFHLLSEIASGIPDVESTLPHTPDYEAWRKALHKDVAAVEARGHTVDVPHEWAAPPATPHTPHGS
jgi:hypothetical protein